MHEQGHSNVFTRDWRFLGFHRWFDPLIQKTAHLKLNTGKNPQTFSRSKLYTIIKGEN